MLLYTEGIAYGRNYYLDPISSAPRLINMRGNGRKPLPSGSFTLTTTGAYEVIKKEVW